MNPLMTLLADHELFHSEFQIRNLIVARTGGTIYGAYKQTIRELWNRLSGIGAELAALGFDQSQTTKESTQNNVCKGAPHLETLIQKTPILKDTIRETAILYGLASWLKSQLGELNRRAQQQLEAELWIYRVKCGIAVDFITIGRLSQPTVELLHALPMELRREILEILNCPEAHAFLIEWYLNDSLSLPSFDEVDSETFSAELVANICESTSWFGLTRKRIEVNSLVP